MTYIFQCSLVYIFLYIFQISDFQLKRKVYIGFTLLLIVVSDMKDEKQIINQVLTDQDALRKKMVHTRGEPQEGYCFGRE